MKVWKTKGIGFLVEDYAGDEAVILEDSQTKNIVPSPDFKNTIQSPDFENLVGSPDSLEQFEIVPAVEDAIPEDKNLAEAPAVTLGKPHNLTASNIESS